MPDALIELFFKTDEKKARELAPDLRSFGIKVPMVFGDDKENLALEALPPEAREIRRRKVLLEIIGAGLTKAIKEFDDLDKRVVASLRSAESWKTVSAIVTAVLSSAVVATLSSGAKPAWSLVLGLANLGSAILTIVIARLQGGDMNMAKDYAMVAAKHEAARGLAPRIAAYATQPELFDDVDARYKEAEELLQFLNVQARRWGTVV